MSIKDEIIEALANEYGIEPDEDTGEYDLTSYEWTAGCYVNHTWMSLADIVYTLADALSWHN